MSKLPHIISHKRGKKGKGNLPRGKSGPKHSTGNGQSHAPNSDELAVDLATSGLDIVNQAFDRADKTIARCMLAWKQHFLLYVIFLVYMVVSISWMTVKVTGEFLYFVSDHVWVLHSVPLS